MNKALPAVVVFAGIGSAAAVVVFGPKPQAVTPPEGLEAGDFIAEPSATQADPREPNPALASLRVPNFELMTATGEAVDQSILDGQYSVIGFIFTHCPLACPLIMQTMQATETFVEQSDAPFYLFSVDPENDTPERLLAYAEKNELGDRWTMLTGSFETTQNIVQSGLKLTLQKDNEDYLIPLDDGGEMVNILHPSRVILIGPDRRVVEFYDSSSTAEAKRLAERLDAIAALESAPDEDAG